MDQRRGTEPGTSNRPRSATLSQRFVAVSRLGLFSGGALRHVLQKLSLMTFGAALVSDAGRRLRLAIDYSGELPAVKTAIVAHAYYPDLIGEILRCRDFLWPDTPIFITVPPDRLEAAAAAVGDARGIALIAAPNRGRDIAPFIQVLRSGVLAPFEAVLKIHTKRSPHLLDGDVRRKMLFDMLCGSRSRVRSVLNSFQDPATGIVGWRSSFRSAQPYWMDNRRKVEALASRLDIKGEPELGFFEGSMFWFRPVALDPLAALGLGVEDFDEEAGQIDGTLHHALERLFTIAAWAGGYEVRDIAGRALRGTRSSPLS